MERPCIVISGDGIREDGSMLNPKYYGPFNTASDAWDWIFYKDGLDKQWTTIITLEKP